MNLKKLRQENKSVAMVGFSSNHRHLAPFDDSNIEIWGLNRLHQQNWFTRSDRMFQLHPITYLQSQIGMSDGDRQHYEWLTEEHPFPIYMQKHYEEFPASVEYPIKRMKKRFGDFYTSTVAYMLAMAIDEGYTHYELYGFDMQADTEYKYQRDSTEYFIGLIEGMGYTVYLPPKCYLLGHNLYGYESVEVGYRQLLEGRKFTLDKQMKKVATEYNQLVGYRSGMIEFVEKYPEYQAEIDTTNLNINEKVGLMNVVKGAQDELQECIDLFDKHYNRIGIEVDTEDGGTDGTQEGERDKDTSRTARDS